MKKTIVHAILLVVCILFVSCDNQSESLPKDFTYTQAAEYLSSVDGLFQLGKDYYLQLCDSQAYFEGWYEIPVSDENIYLSRESIEGKSINFVGSLTTLSLNVLDFNRFFSVERYGNLYFAPLTLKFQINENVSYLGSQPNNIAYMFEKYNIKTSPHWTEWVDYDIQYYRETWDCSQGKGYGFWYNPLTGQCEECIYLRELEDKTEIYVIYQKMSLFYRSSCFNPFLMSEDLYEKLQTELGEDFREKDYKKGSVLEFYSWFSGGYTEKVSDMFKDIRVGVYYPFYGNGRNFADLLEASGYSIPEIFIEDMRNLGVDYDNIMVNIIKITVPHDGTINDIIWDLIG